METDTHKMPLYPFQQELVDLLAESVSDGAKAIRFAEHIGFGSLRTVCGFAARSVSGRNLAVVVSPNVEYYRAAAAEAGADMEVTSYKAFSSMTDHEVASFGLVVLGVASSQNPTWMANAEARIRSLNPNCVILEAAPAGSPRGEAYRDIVIERGDGLDVNVTRYETASSRPA